MKSGSDVGGAYNDSYRYGFFNCDPGCRFQTETEAGRLGNRHPSSGSQAAWHSLDQQDFGRSYHQLFPEEAFKEAMRLTLGLPYRKTTPVKVTEDMIVKEIKEEEPEPEIKLNEEAYQAIVARYTDKSGHLSYDLINKEMIRFAKSSSIVRGMIQEGKKASVIRNYIVSNKFRNIADNDDLTNADIKLIVEMLDEVSPKGVFKELDAEIRKMLGAQKKAV